MANKSIPKRTRFFLAGEGESEQSFCKWLYDLSNQQFLHVHLDCQLLGGGGYKAMLKKAIEKRTRKEKTETKFKYSILLIDSDRAQYGDDGWTVDQLKQEASKNKFSLCFQRPKIEGLFLRMFPGKESFSLEALNVDKQLTHVWPNYQKPVDARALALKFSLNDLLRASNFDEDLKNLLTIIGLEKN